MDREDLRKVAGVRGCADAMAAPLPVLGRASSLRLSMGLPRAALDGAAQIDTDRETGAAFFHAGGVRWHVRRAGASNRPCALLLHGTGSASSSWLRILPLLDGHFRLLAPDLPGHGLSATLSSGAAGVGPFAAALAALVQELGERPRLIIGHSAGAAIAARMALDARGAPVDVISLNGAMRPLNGWTAATFLPLARLIGLNPFVPGLLAALVASLATNDPAAVRRLLDATGSKIDPLMIEHYEQLLRSRAHVAGTLRMLASWDLRDLARALPRLGARLTLIAGSGDRTVAPADARWLQEHVPGSGRIDLAGLGHLAHEEAPAAVAEVVLSVAQARGALAGAASALSPTQERGS